MKKRTFVIFVGYIWTKTLLGLATTPNRAVREFTRRTVLLPTLFTPLYALLILFIIGRLGSLLLDLHGLTRFLFAFIASCTLIYILLWQLLLLYLFLVVYLSLRK